LRQKVVEFVSEAAFLTQVIDLAQALHWRAHHVRPAWSKKGWRTPIQGDPGFPDLVLVRPPRVIFAELKSERGRLSDEQEIWIDWLEKCHLGEIYIWKPSDWDDIVSKLR